MYSPVLQRHIALGTRAARSRQGRPEGQPRVHDQPPLRPGRRPRRPQPDVRAARRRPGVRHQLSTGDRIERRPTLVSDTGASREYDAIVIGGGHNGLVNGAYLAKAGLRTLILERRHLVGGAAITEELRPGFQFTTFSYALSLLRPEIVHELDLVQHGFMPLLMPATFCPMENGDSLVMGQDRNENIKEIAPPLQARRRRLRPVQPRHHDGDPRRQAAVRQGAARTCSTRRPMGWPRWPTWRAHLRGIEPRVLHDLVRLLTGSAADFLDDYFESPILKGWLASSGIIGTKVGPMSQGSGLCSCSTTWASTTAASARGRSTRVATAASRRSSPAPRSRSGPRSWWAPRSTASSPATGGRRAWR